MSTPSADIEKDEATQELSSLSSLEKDLHPEILRHIFTFVGGYEYRFMCNISKTIRQRYVEQFPEKLTSDACVGLSVDHAKMYLKECRLYVDEMGSEKSDKRRNIIKQIGRNGRMDILEWFMRTYRKFQPGEVCKLIKYSTQNNKVDFLRCLTERKDLVYGGLMNFCASFAAESGNLDSLKLLSKYLFQNHYMDMRRWCMERAARGGHIECLQYLRGEEASWDGGCYREAAKGGHLSCIQYLYENGCTWEIPANGRIVRVQDIMTGAAEHSFECFRFLYDHDCPHDISECLKAAARGGNIEFLRLYTNRPTLAVVSPFHAELCSEASRSENKDCLQFLHQQGLRLVSEACHAASKAGSLDCLRYLHENGCEWNEEMCCTAAVKEGHVSCLRYLHENGCILTPDLYHASVCRILDNDFRTKPINENSSRIFSYIACLKYLKDADVETPMDTVEYAMDLNRDYMFPYFNLDAWKNDVDRGNEPLLQAIQMRWSVSSIRCLYKDEWKTDTTYCRNAAQCGSLAILKYLLDEGFKAPKDICVDAAANRHVECLKVLHQRGFDLTQDVLCTSTNAQCIKYCAKHGLRRRSSRKRSAAEAL